MGGCIEREGNEEKRSESVKSKKSLSSPDFPSLSLSLSLSHILSLSLSRARALSLSLSLSLNVIDRSLFHGEEKKTLVCGLFCCRQTLAHILACDPFSTDFQRKCYHCRAAASGGLCAARLSHGDKGRTGVCVSVSPCLPLSLCLSRPRAIALYRSSSQTVALIPVYTAESILVYRCLTHSSLFQFS